MTVNAFRDRHQLEAFESLGLRKDNPFILSLSKDIAFTSDPWLYASS